jgi:hypothetical protein
MDNYVLVNYGFFFKIIFSLTLNENQISIFFIISFYIIYYSYISYIGAWKWLIHDFFLIEACFHNCNKILLKKKAFHNKTCFVIVKKKQTNKRIRFFNLKYIFFLFSSNHYVFCKYFFLIVFTFCSINYAANR